MIGDSNLVRFGLFVFFGGGVTTVITDPRPVILKYVQPHYKSVTIVVSIQAGKLHIESDQKPMFLLICSLEANENPK